MKPLPFSLFLALKYLKPKRSYFSVVTLISLLGVLLGVAVLIIVLSVMSGFDDMWKEKILSFNAHITVSAPAGLEDPEGVREVVLQVPGVAGAAPFIQGPVVIRHRGGLYTPLLRGASAELEKTIESATIEVKEGSLDLGYREAAVGRDLAYSMGLRPGDRLLVNSPSSFMQTDEIHLPEELAVKGVFEVGMWEYDAGFILCSLETARDVFGIDRGAHALKVMTRDPYGATVVANRITGALGPGYSVTTWMEQNRQLFGALRVEKNMMFFLLIFIAVVAGFGITNTLITLAVQKTGEIGLLKAIGFPSACVMRIFFWLGLVQGVAGTAAGVATGLLVLRYRNALMRGLSDTFHLELFPKELYHLSEIPARTSPGDIAIVALSVVAICTVAGFIPAYRAARLDPVAALRHE